MTLRTQCASTPGPHGPTFFISSQLSSTTDRGSHPKHRPTSVACHDVRQHGQQPRVFQLSQVGNAQAPTSTPRRARSPIRRLDTYPKNHNYPLTVNECDELPNAHMTRLPLVINQIRRLLAGVDVHLVLSHLSVAVPELDMVRFHRSVSPVFRVKTPRLRALTA